MQHIKTVCLVWNKTTLLVKHILGSTRAGISKTPAYKSTIADMHECRWHTCHICTKMATQELIYRLKLPWHSPGICCKTLASLRWHPHRICTQAEVCSCDGIPTASAGCSCHGIPTACAAKLWPRSAATAMASPPHLHKQTYVLQIRWHPHCICRL
jgi:hypothetical protein